MQSKFAFWIHITVYPGFIIQRDSILLLITISPAKACADTFRIRMVLRSVRVRRFLSSLPYDQLIPLLRWFSLLLSSQFPTLTDQPFHWLFIVPICGRTNDLVMTSSYFRTFFAVPGEGRYEKYYWLELFTRSLPHIISYFALVWKPSKVISY